MYGATAKDPELDPFAREYALTLEKGTRLAIDKDWPVFQKIGDALVSEHYDGSLYCAFELNTIPDILCGGATNVNFDFNHNLLQFEDQIAPLELITLTLLPFNGRGIAVFAWYGQGSANENLIHSLLTQSRDEIPNAIVRLVFQYFDNFFVAPKWWNHLTEDKKEALGNRFESTFVPLPFGLPIDDIRSDGMEYVDWKVTNIRTNLYL